MTFNMIYNYNSIIACILMNINEEVKNGIFFNIIPWSVCYCVSET